MKVDVQQVYINTAAIFGIGVPWFNFNKNVFTTVRHLVGSSFFTREWPPCDACFIDYDASGEFEAATICIACFKSGKRFSDLKIKKCQT